MKLISFLKLGENRNSPRVWIESRRLKSLGFTPGVGFTVEPRLNGIRLRPALLAENHVSKRISARQERPIIDIANRLLLSPLDGFAEIKIIAAFKQINVMPSVRGFHIRRGLTARLPFKTIEVFCGGGTLSAAIASSADFTLVAGVEVEPKYADVWQQAHPRAFLYQADIRRIHASEIPAHDVLVASIPCTSHSTLGRAKKSLAGKPELGDTGDLFLSVAHIVAHHLPSACVFENVPAFGNSLACLSLAQHMQKIGYSLTESIIDPLNEWNEPQGRKRWIMVATLKAGFKFTRRRFLSPEQLVSFWTLRQIRTDLRLRGLSKASRHYAGITSATRNSATDLASPQSTVNQQECRRLFAHTTKSTPGHLWKLLTGCGCSTKKKSND